MKGIVGEYGMLVLAVIAASIIAVYSFGTQQGGIREQAASIRPRPQLKAGTNISELQEILNKEPPQLEILTPKLTAGKTYAWMEFVKKAEDSDGQRLAVEIECVAGFDGTEREETETTVQKGTYMVTYCVRDQYGLATKKQVCFVAD